MEKRPLVWWLPPIAASLLFVADRLSKVFFLGHATEQYTLLSGWLWLQLHLNTQMALSLPLFPMFYYGAVSLVLLLLCAKSVAVWQQGRLVEFTCICVIVAGAISNLLDRLYYGGVVDFIAVKLGSVFNLADIMIVLSVLGWVLILWKYDRAKIHARTETI